MQSTSIAGLKCTVHVFASKMSKNYKCDVGLLLHFLSDIFLCPSISFDYKLKSRN